MQRFIYERSATNIRDWSLAYSFICISLLFRNRSINENGCCILLSVIDCGRCEILNIVILSNKYFSRQPRLIVIEDLFKPEFLLYRSISAFIFLFLTTFPHSLQISLYLTNDYGNQNLNYNRNKMMTCIRN